MQQPISTANCVAYMSRDANRGFPCMNITNQSVRTDNFTSSMSRAGNLGSHCEEN